MGATRKSLLKVFVTVGFTIGAIGTVAGLIFGALVLIFRQPIVHLIERLTGENLWDPSVRFLTDLPSRTDPVEVTVIVLHGAGAQLPRDALSGLEGRGHRSGAGAAV